MLYAVKQRETEVMKDKTTHYICNAVHKLSDCGSALIPLVVWAYPLSISAFTEGRRLRMMTDGGRVDKIQQIKNL